MGPFPVSPPGRGWNVLGEEGEASWRKLLSRPLHAGTEFLQEEEAAASCPRFDLGSLAEGPGPGFFPQRGLRSSGSQSFFFF